MAATAVEKYGWPLVGMLRSFYDGWLKDALAAADVPLLVGFRVSEVIEDEYRVTVVAEDGRSEEGSFVIVSLGEIPIHLSNGLRKGPRTAMHLSRGVPFQAMTNYSVLLP